MPNEKLDCDIINYCQRLLSSTFKDVQSLQDTRLVPVRKDGSWVYALKFKPAQGFCGQIHHNGNDHWVTSVCPEPSRILVYDSSISKRETITDSLKILLDKQQQRTSHRNYNSKSAAADKLCGLWGICSCIPHRILSYWKGVVIQLNIRYTADAPTPVHVY